MLTISQRTNTFVRFVEYRHGHGKYLCYNIQEQAVYPKQDAPARDYDI